MDDFEMDRADVEAQEWEDQRDPDRASLDAMDDDRRALAALCMMTDVRWANEDGVTVLYQDGPIVTRPFDLLADALTDLRLCGEMAMLPELHIEYHDSQAVFLVQWWEAPEGVTHPWIPAGERYRSMREHPATAEAMARAAVEDEGE